MDQTHIHPYASGRRSHGGCKWYECRLHVTFFSSEEERHTLFYSRRSQGGKFPRVSHSLVLHRNWSLDVSRPNFDTGMRRLLTNLSDNSNNAAWVRRSIRVQHNVYDLLQWPPVLSAARRWPVTLEWNKNLASATEQIKLSMWTHERVVSPKVEKIY